MSVWVGAWVGTYLSRKKNFSFFSEGQISVELNFEKAG